MELNALGEVGTCQRDYTRMTVAPLSLLALVAQAPMGRLEVTTTEEIAVVCIMIGLLVVAFWMRRHI